MRQTGLFVLLIGLFILSCGTAPVPTSPVPETAPVSVQPAEPPAAPVQPVEETVPPEPEPAAIPADEEVFNPASISEERVLEVREDIQTFIANLNRIIRSRNYNEWRTHLSDSYFEEIGSNAFLERMTEELYNRDQIVALNLGRDPRRVQKKILRNPRDYFDNIVVPSRSNDRMDDLAFISENRVKAYTINSHGQRLVLYDLEFIDGRWKIIN